MDNGSDIAVVRALRPDGNGCQVPDRCLGVAPDPESSPPRAHREPRILAGAVVCNLPFAVRPFVAAFAAMTVGFHSGLAVTFSLTASLFQLSWNDLPLSGAVDS